MNNATVNKQEQMKGRHYHYLIAFAFGCGAAFGAAISPWITGMLTH